MVWTGYLTAVLLICSRTSAERRQDSEKPHGVNQTQTHLQEVTQIGKNQTKNEVTTQIPSNTEEPYFYMSAIRNVSSVVGQTSQLHCTVRNLGNKTVYWTRNRDLHILTGGSYTYTGDERFSSIHRSSSDTWTLNIKNTRMSDMGEYWCQVNTEPKLQITFALVVKEPHPFTSSPFSACIDDFDCVNLGNDFACFQYICYPWKNDTRIPEIHRKQTCKSNEDCLDSSLVCYRHHNRRNVNKGICIEDWGTCEDGGHDDCTKGPGLRCCFGEYCCEEEYFTQLKTWPCSSHYSCRDLQMGNFCCPRNGTFPVCCDMDPDLSTHLRTTQRPHLRTTQRPHLRTTQLRPLRTTQLPPPLQENPNVINQTQTHLQEVKQIANTTVKNELTTQIPAATESDNMLIQKWRSGEPFFDRSVMRNVSSVVGQTSQLDCTVRNVGNKTVSWIRKNDQHILTVGKYTFISDERISSLHRISSDTWTLNIRNTRMSDMGEYWCQVNTNPMLQITIALAVEDNMLIQRRGEPYFDRSVIRNVSSVVGQPTQLHCTVRNAGNKTVSWIRKNDQHLLTVGRYTYTSDERFSSIHRSSSDTWTLNIRNTRMSDMGEYWCQVNTNPMLQITIALAVEEPRPFSSSPFSACIDDGDCWSLGNDFACFQYICYPWKNDTRIPEIHRKQTCKRTEDCLDSSLVCYRHHNRRNVWMGLCLEDWGTCEDGGHDDCTKGPGHWCCFGQYCCEEEYFTQLKTSPCSSHYSCRDLQMGNFCCPRNGTFPVCCDMDPNLHPPLRTTQLPPLRTTQLRPLRTTTLPPPLQDIMPITSVTPHQVNIATSTTLDINLPLETLSTLPAHFLCQFKAYGATLSSNATKTSTGVSCTTPAPHFLPSIPHGKTHFVARLRLIDLDGSSIGIKPFENLSFYDCGAHSSCGSCVSSDFQCDWCVERHRCTTDGAANCRHDGTVNCRHDTYVTGSDRIGGGIRSRPGPGFCPSISPIQGEPTEIFVHHGSIKSVKIKVSNHETFMNKTRFVCQFNIEGRVTSVNAHQVNTVDSYYSPHGKGSYYPPNAEGPFISCDQMEFSYTSRSPQSTASLDVIWDGSNRLDNPSNIRVTIYKCEHLAPSCGTCASKEIFNKYSCGWCASQHTCRSYSHPKPSCPNEILITNTSNLCPSVVSVTPSHQPVQTQHSQPSLNLVMEHLANVPERLACVYSSSGRRLTVNGTRTATGVSCGGAHLAPPAAFQAFVAAHPEPEFTSKLSIKTVDDEEVASTDFTFFDCSAFSSCTSCVSSHFGCNWCFDADVCTYDSRMTCRNDTKNNLVITGINKIDPGIYNGPTFCPAIRPRNSGLTQILVPSGSERNIQVNVDIKIETVKKKSQFSCDITIEGKHSPWLFGRLNYSSNSLTCDAMKFNYTSQTPTKIAEMSIRTYRGGREEFLDNPEKIQIVMYKCNQMASHCAPCLKLDRKYQCGWCQASKTCEVVEECRTSGNRVDWVSGNQTCTRQRGPAG